MRATRSGAACAIPLALAVIASQPLPTQAQAPARYMVKPIAEKKIGHLPGGPLYWRVEDFPTVEQAKAAAGPDGFTFVENHCPICAAATACQGFCATEIELFQAALGPGVDVSRTEHIINGERRCAYRITTSS